MHDRAVTDRDQLSDDRGKIIGEMNDDTVLNVGARSDDDAVDVAAQNGSEPDARFLLQGDVADHGRARNDERARMDARSQL